MARLPKYSSAGGEEAATALKRSRVSSPNAEVWRFRNVSDPLPSLLAPTDPGGVSMPNFAGTEDAIGPSRAYCEMPLLSNEAGNGASSTLNPFVLAGDRPKPSRLESSSLGEPNVSCGPEAYVVSIAGTLISGCLVVNGENASSWV